ncbi:MAG: ATP-dependent Zn protease [Mesorhizobium sp.]
MNEVALRRLALKATGMTGADIERVVREARQKARRAGRPLIHSDLEECLLGSRPARSPSMRRQIAIHESGHVIARLAYGLGRVTLITIDDRDGHGYVESASDQATADAEGYLTHLVQVYLAGRAAERIVVGKALAGSGGSDRSDLARASRLSYMLEASLGYGSRSPLLYRDPDSYDVEMRSDPKLAARVNSRLEAADAAVSDLLSHNQGALQHLTAALVCHGTLEGADLRAALAEARERIGFPSPRSRTEVAP